MKKTWIKIKRGILEPKHIEKLGQAWYLYFYILDQADWETGSVKYWKDEYASDELEKPLSLVREHRKSLEKEGYITCVKGQHDQTIIIHNWTDPRRYDGVVLNKTESEEKEDLSNVQSSPQSSPQTFKTPEQNSFSSYNHISHNHINTETEIKSNYPVKEERVIKSNTAREITYTPCNDDGMEQKPLHSPAIKDSDRLLIDTFSDLTNIKYIPPVSSSDWKSFQVNWLKPLRKMQQLAGTTERAIEIIDSTVNKMRANGWQISTPKSLEKTFAAILGLANNQEDRYLGMTAQGALYQKADGSQCYK